ncbi:MAG: metallophosphoesterase [Chlamydiae bacterium]|nr:metallophosphoesterase [Chlamydiota bacterium]MBI3265673.1 metallophosphoesterase [Chlamydiota bacterium]
MNILAVSDKESSTLMNWIEVGDPTLRAVDLVVSCGDLSSSYLEFIRDALGKDLLYVRGNHDPKARWGIDSFSGPRPLHEGHVYEHLAEGLEDLHGKIFRFRDWVVVGFEGSLWYNGQGPQYHEEEMKSMVRKMEYRLRLEKVFNRIRKISKKVMVISHAPPLGVHDASDLCHKGFECFHHMIHAFSPVLWIHGHTATQTVTQNQASTVGKTIVLNAYEHKFIHVEEGHEPLISYRPTVLVNQK